ncbi:hypothetical protein K458DRAFT_420066 [Lentithecium fluviatile CBS 122367]|uniref:DNA polymerase delta subunit 3 n=1 Tax=Lentithecium fluviatile CBS 122367 TaxID=1168545 RepID=A0A6G1IV48_9PLEO|nr:hypothetical protein K458DRAFT_420066 [Lentithecium fluviatile CBS 122367]
MAEENYKEYLAARVLTDNRPVTYRLLSRALKVNVNTAKQMLYEFHTKQNAKKPNTIHATYLLIGKMRTSEHINGVNGRDGDDTVMRSSPFISSMPEPEGELAEEPVPTTSIVLVREEELEKTKSEFEDIGSIHIYSLEPGPIENLNVLSVCNQEIAMDFASEDPLEQWRVYGSIHNPYIKRRTTKYNPVPPKVPAKPTVKPTHAAAAVKKEDASGLKRKGSVSEDNTSGQSTPQSGPVSLKKSDSKSNLKKDKSVGDLFKSFAKAKPKAKEAEKSKESTPAPVEDEQMQGMSEDEGDENDAPEVKFDEEKAAAAKKAREEREEKLRQMMEDDVDMPDAEPEEEKDSQDAPLDTAVSSKPAESGSQGSVTIQGGRRRGRRRVMKKKKVKDEDGYLVTKEEAVWESFSEEDPEPKKAKPVAKPASTAKGKKAGGKGQGSIASFFKKA